jgi:AcrR family transcriptional regulator
VTTARLPAEKRREALLETACACFSRGSYRGTTTADIASAAGVTEPILYRHFDSKRDLYIACQEEIWEQVQALWNDAVAAEPDPGLWVAAMGRAFLESERYRPVISNLWVQSLAEAAEDAEIRRYLKGHMLEVHGFVVDVIRRAQAAGGVPEERNAVAEAWIFIAVGLLAMADRCLEGMLGESWVDIRAARLAWLTGRS